MKKGIFQLFSKGGVADCSSISSLLSLYVDHMVTGSEKKRVEAHLQACEECRASMSWMEATKQAVLARPVAIPPSDLRARIRQAIAETEAARQPVILRPTRRPIALRPALGYGFSIALFAAVGTSLLMNAHGPHMNAPVERVSVPGKSASNTQVSPTETPSRSSVQRIAILPKHTSSPSHFLAAPTPISEQPATVATRNPSRPIALPAQKSAIIDSSEVVAANDSVAAPMTLRVHTHTGVSSIKVHTTSSLRSAVNVPAQIASNNSAHSLPHAVVNPAGATPTAPKQDVASLPSPPLQQQAPIAPVAPGVPSASVAVDVASVPRSLNSTLQTIALSVDADKALTVHDIALTSHTMAARFADETSDSSGTVAITAGPVH